MRAANNLFNLAGIITDAVNGLVQFRPTLVEMEFDDYMKAAMKMHADLCNQYGQSFSSCDQMSEHLISPVFGHCYSILG